jgi:hypothetical protein
MAVESVYCFGRSMAPEARLFTQELSSNADFSNDHQAHEAAQDVSAAIVTNSCVL